MNECGGAAVQVISVSAAQLLQGIAVPAWKSVPDRGPNEQSE